MVKRISRLEVCLPLILAAALLTACGSTRSIPTTAPVPSVAANATTSDGEVILAVTAVDYAFGLNRPTVPAGRVHVQLINRSPTVEHEVWVYPQTQPKLTEMLALKNSGKDVEELDYLQGVAGHVENVPAGQTAAFDATLTAGTYELGCFITSDVGGKKMVHYDMGMHIPVTVQ
jgi:uncharacterized cupredoxin-like copper-binding protein